MTFKTLQPKGESNYAIEITISEKQSADGTRDRIETLYDENGDELYSQVVWVNDRSREQAGEWMRQAIVRCGGDPDEVMISSDYHLS